MPTTVLLLSYAACAVRPACRHEMPTSSMLIYYRRHDFDEVAEAACLPKVSMPRLRRSACRGVFANMSGARRTAADDDAVSGYGCRVFARVR